MNSITKIALIAAIIFFANVYQNTYGQRLLVSPIHTAETFNKGEKYWSLGVGGNYQNEVGLIGLDYSEIEKAYFIAFDRRWGLNDYFDLGLHISTYLWDILLGIDGLDLMVYADFRYQLIGKRNKKWACSFGLAIGFISRREMRKTLSFNIPVHISYRPTDILIFYMNPKYINWDDWYFEDFIGRFVGSSYGIRFGKKVGFFLEGTYLFQVKEFVYYPEQGNRNIYCWKLGLDIIISKKDI